MQVFEILDALGDFGLILATSGITAKPVATQIIRGGQNHQATQVTGSPAEVASPRLQGGLPMVAEGGRTKVLTPIQGPVTLDGKYLGDLSGAVDADGNGDVDAVRLLEIIKPLLDKDLLEQVQTRVAGRERVSMAEVTTDGLSLTFDPFSLGFVIRLAATGRSRNDISFRSRAVPDPAAFAQPANLSAGMNATMLQRYDHGSGRFAPLEGAFDLLANVGGFGGVTLTAGLDYDGDGGRGGAGGGVFRRREARLTKDLFGPAIRLTAGEFTPLIQSFQGSQRLLGVSVTRAYSTIRPFQNVRPSGRREFILDRESSVEVEVDGIIVERVRLTPGPYSIGDFPFGQGASTVRLLINDEAGRREIASFDVFGGDELLDQNITDFGISAGIRETGRLQYG